MRLAPVTPFWLKLKHDWCQPVFRGHFMGKSWATSRFSSGVGERQRRVCADAQGLRRHRVRRERARRPRRRDAYLTEITERRPRALVAYRCRHEWLFRRRLAGAYPSHLGRQRADLVDRRPTSAPLGSHRRRRAVRAAPCARGTHCLRTTRTRARSTPTPVRRCSDRTSEPTRRSPRMRSPSRASLRALARPAGGSHGKGVARAAARARREGNRQSRTDPDPCRASGRRSPARCWYAASTEPGVR
jgi:hypothetical protein